MRRILIIRPNHRLGNLLLITPLLQEVSATFPEAQIDLFIKGGTGNIIFKNYPSVKSIFALPKKPFKSLLTYSATWIRMVRGKYDLVINAVNNSSSGRLAAKMIDAPLKISGDPEVEPGADSDHWRHIALAPIFSFRKFVSRLGIKLSADTFPVLDLRLSSGEIANGRIILRKLTDNDKPTIALYTFATGAKCFSTAWWESFHEQLQTAFDGYNIIEVLPVENVSQLTFRIPSFYSKDIREIGSVIANCAAFIGADSGIMHLASASGTPTIGLFAVTEPAIYRPYNPGSLAIDTRSGSIDQWITTIRTALIQEQTHSE